MCKGTHFRERLLQDLQIAQTIQLPGPYRFKLAEYEQDRITGVIAHLTRTAISYVEPAYKIGRVYSFNVTPRYGMDPVMIYSRVGDLKPYYDIWRQVMILENWENVSNRMLHRYDNAIKHFLKTSDLDPHESAFAVIEALYFKNERMWR